MMRQAQLFPVSVAGSWTRAPWLVQALRRRQTGEISFAEFNRLADNAVLAALKYQEDAGVSCPMAKSAATTFIPSSWRNATA